MIWVLIIIVTLLIILMIHLYIEKSRLRLIIRNLENHNRTLQDMYDGVRSFKHDFSNFVQALNGYVETKDYDGITSMCSAAFDECKNINNLSMLNSSIINNSAIYNLIINKYYLAQGFDINMNIEVRYDLKELKIDTYKLCRIVGILLDNAIEAAKECKDKIVNIKFYYDKGTNYKYIKIENSYQNADIDIDKIFEKGYSTKDSNSAEHGLGLWNVKKIIDKDESIKILTSKEKLFTQILQIY